MEPFRTAGGYRGQGDGRAVGRGGLVYTCWHSPEKGGKGRATLAGVRRWKCVGRERRAGKVFVDRGYTCELTL